MSFGNEDNEYSDFNLRILIKNLEKELKQIGENDDELTIGKLKRKLEIANELVQRYRALSALAEDDRDYAGTSDEYEYYADKLKERIEKYNEEKHKQSQEAESWREYEYNEKNFSKDEEEYER